VANDGRQRLMARQVSATIIRRLSSPRPARRLPADRRLTTNGGGGAMRSDPRWSRFQFYCRFERPHAAAMPCSGTAGGVGKRHWLSHTLVADTPAPARFSLRVVRT
jgi:hypothetical protein